jgi:hypothetical protein
MSQKRSNSGRMLSAIVALFGAGLMLASVAAAMFMPDRQVVQRLSFPVASSTFPVGPGDTIADRVLGQMDFFHNSGNFVDASTLRLLFASQVAIDQSSNPNRIYVADFGNNRVLGWSSVAALANGSPANLVIGQPDLFSGTECTPGTTVASAASLCLPLGVAVDSSGNLYVADTYNNRVLECNTPFTQTGMPGAGDAVADAVFGQQGSFTSSSCNLGGGPAASTTLCKPTGLAIDNTGVLYISDTGNSRVLEYDFPSIETAADDVFGQNGHFNGTSCNVNGRNPDTLCNPQGIGVDSAGNLYVADTSNSRVLEYNNPIANDTSADHVYGQGNFSAGNCNGVGIGANSLCKPTGVAQDAAGNLYVADQGNNRVLEYTMPLSNAGADKVFGQAGMAGDTPNYTGMVDAKGLWAPGGVAVDSIGNLYVVDDTNSRVLEYDFALTSDTTADVVLGQPDFNHNSPNAIDASGYAEVSHIAIDNTVTPPRLWVADDQNNRVLGYNNAATFANGAPADVVVGQPDFFTGGSNCAATPTSSNLCEPVAAAVDSVGNLYVVDDSYNRVLKFLAPVNTGDAAVAVIGQPNFASRQCNGGLSTPTAKTLCNPQAVAVDALNNLWIADVDNHRVLEYPNPGNNSNPSATHVFGQPGYITKDCNHGGSITAATLCRPSGVAVDSMGRLFIADDSNNRVLRYSTPLTKSSADLVYGQGAAGNNFSAGGANAGGIGPATLSSPEDVAIDIKGNLYVADFINNRILHYAAGFGINTVSADTVFGQGGSFFSGQGNLGGSTPNAATLWGPRGLAVDKAGDLYSAELNNNRVLQYEAPFGAPSPTPTPGNATISPTGLKFGSVATGDTSAVKKATLTNTGAGTIIINAINRVGSNPTDFAQNNNCIGPLGGGKSCTINVSFTPMAVAGTQEAAQIVIHDNAKNAPQTLAVYGTWALPASLTPASVNFGNVAVANTSLAKNLTLANNRSKSATISSISFAGTNMGDFSKTTTCGAGLAAFSTCTISVKFTPGALGARSAQLQALLSTIASPVFASLLGTGAAPVTVSPTSLSFGNVTKGTTSAAKAVTLTNNRATTLTVGAIGLGGTNPGDFLKTTACGVSLAPFTGCTVSVQFKPTAIGARSATLSVADSPDTASPHHVTLSGTGQ